MYTIIVCGDSYLSKHFRTKILKGTVLKIVLNPAFGKESIIVVLEQESIIFNCLFQELSKVDVDIKEMFNEMIKQRDNELKRLELTDD